MTESDSESECIAILDKWILVNRDIVYNENIKGPDNSQEVLEEYTCKLREYGNSLISAIRKENTNALFDLDWPNELMECIHDVNTKNDIIDRIQHWCITYPFVKSVLHMNELAAENAGVN